MVKIHSVPKSPPHQADPSKVSVSSESPGRIQNIHEIPKFNYPNLTQAIGTSDLRRAKDGDYCLSQAGDIAVSKGQSEICSLKDLVDDLSNKDRFNGFVAVYSD